MAGFSGYKKRRTPSRLSPIFLTFVLFLIHRAFDASKILVKLAAVVSLRDVPALTPEPTAVLLEKSAFHAGRFRTGRCRKRFGRTAKSCRTLANGSRPEHVRPARFGIRMLMNEFPDADCREDTLRLPPQSRAKHAVSR